MRRNKCRTLALLLGIGLLAGCENAAEPKETSVLEGLAPGIHPIVVVGGRSGNVTQVELHLKRIQVDASISSYQGELEYDTGALTLAGAELPGGIVGAWNEPSTGKVRFAGAALEGIGENPVLLLRFTSKGEVQRGSFKLKVEEIVAAADFQSLSSTLVVREQPLFSRSPLQ